MAMIWTVRVMQLKMLCLAWLNCRPRFEFNSTFFVLQWCDSCTWMDKKHWPRAFSYVRTHTLYKISGRSWATDDLIIHWIAKSCEDNATISYVEKFRQWRQIAPRASPWDRTNSELYHDSIVQGFESQTKKQNIAAHTIPKAFVTNMLILLQKTL